MPIGRATNLMSQWLLRKYFGAGAIAGFKTGMAAVLCLWPGHLFGLAHSYWAAISAIVVMGPDRDVTFTYAVTG